MNIHEFQAKRLLKSYGINVPAGEAASTSEQAEEIGARLGGEKWMVKAQIHAGGRGEGKFQAGGSGIRVADSLTAIRHHAKDMLGQNLVTRQTAPAGMTVRQVYVERALNVERELALSLFVDDKSGGLVLLLSKIGGVQIESVVSRIPESVYFIPVSIREGVDTLGLERALEQFDLFESSKSQLRDIVSKIFRLFCGKDAGLVEVNPIAIVEDTLYALDAKISVDNNALFRQQDIRLIESGDERHDSSRSASLDGFNYIPLEGNIGCMSVGAGFAMAVLDAGDYCAGQPANFLDLPPDSKINRVRSALELLLAKPGIESVVINVFGGGIMRCDTVADAILVVNRNTPIRVPLIVRLAGTNAELANRRLRESLPDVILASNLAEAAGLAVEHAGKHKPVGKRASAESWFCRLFSGRKSS